MAEKTIQKYIRWIERFNKKGELVGYDLLKSTRDVEEFIAMQKQVEANKELIERDNFEKVYSLRNLILCINYSLPRGLISGDIRTETLEMVDLIIKEDDCSKQADLIYELLNKEGLEEFKSFFGKVAE